MLCWTHFYQFRQANVSSAAHYFAKQLVHLIQLRKGSILTTLLSVLFKLVSVNCVYKESFRSMIQSMTRDIHKKDTRRHLLAQWSTQRLIQRTNLWINLFRRIQKNRLAEMNQTLRSPHWRKFRAKTEPLLLRTQVCDLRRQSVVTLAPVFTDCIV